MASTTDDDPKLEWRLDTDRAPSGDRDGPEARLISRESSLTQDPAWLATYLGKRGRSWRWWSLESERGPVGRAIFLSYPGRLGLSLGGRVLLRCRVRRLDATGLPAIDPEVGANRQVQYVAELFDALSRQVASDEVIFLEAVFSDSSLHTALLESPSVREHFHVLLHGRAYDHRFIELPPSYEAYLKALSGKTRSDLSRTRRRLASKFEGAIEVKRFEACDEVRTFVDDAMRVSAQTWQYGMGAGLRDREELVERFERTAQLGWFRSYVLYLNREPFAFQVGHVHGTTFFAQEIGYLPEVAKLQVGIYLHTEVLMDLFEMPTPPLRFDFGTTDTIHKKRLSTDSRRAGFYYVIPRGLRGTSLALAIRAAAKADETGHWMLDRIDELRRRVVALRASSR